MAESPDLQAKLVRLTLKTFFSHQQIPHAMLTLASRIFLAPALMSGSNHKEQKSRSVLVDQRFKLPTSGSEKSRETLVVRERKHIVCVFYRLAM